MEVSMLSSLKHKNVVSLVGFCDEKDEKIIITKYDETRGMLYQYLSDPLRLTWVKRLKISVGLAHALSYIHYDERQDFSVIHRRIDSSKVVLNDNWEPKLSSFEGSMKIEVSQRHHSFHTNTCVGVKGYTDPTYIETNSVNHKSDMYSFGIVLFGLLCGRDSITEDQDNKYLAPMAIFYYKEKLLHDLIDPDLFKQMDQQSFNVFAEIAYDCLNEDRSQRPNIYEIVTRLEKALELQLERENVEHSEAAGKVEGTSFNHEKVPIEEEVEAIDWLRAQQQQQHNIPRCFFSGRRQARINNGYSSLIDYGGGNDGSSLVSIAGLGSAVFFRHFSPFSLHDWRSIKRFLSKKCPLIRAYGAIRFDALSNISSEWEAFGSFYFMIPQVEFNEFEGSSMLVTTIAWDESLSWTFGKAVHELQRTMRQVSSNIVKLRKEVPNTSILSSNNVPSKKLWDFGVNRALQMINKNSSPLTKCPMQPGTTECGYFVLKFMKEIVKHGVRPLENDNIGGDSNEYTNADFDDIREEWAIYVSNFIFR